MFRVIGFLAKTIPSVWVVIELNIFLYNIFMQINSVFWRRVLIGGIPSMIIIGVLWYITTFKDALERQLSKEQDENESRNYTVEIQTKRMFRKYTLYVVVAIVSTIAYFYYKSNIMAMIIRAASIFGFFLLGESFRIVDIGLKEKKRNNKQLENSEEV